MPNPSLTVLTPHCPKCEMHLDSVSSKHGLLWFCRLCHGRSIAMAVLRKVLEPSAVNGVWKRALASRESGRSGAPCPFCHRPTSPLVQSFPDGGAEIDVCVPCAAVWFDGGEMERMGRYFKKPSSPRSALSLGSGMASHRPAEVSSSTRSSVEWPDLALGDPSIGDPSSLISDLASFISGLILGE